MASCNEDLKREGKPYPRTCAICGIGKCQRQDRHENAALKQIAGLIQKLSYRDMQTLADIVGRSLSIEDRGRVADTLLCVMDNLPGDKSLAMPMPEPGDYRR